MGKAGLSRSWATLCIQQESGTLSPDNGASEGSKSGCVMGALGLGGAFWWRCARRLEGSKSAVSPAGLVKTRRFCSSSSDSTIIATNY